MKKLLAGGLLAALAIAVIISGPLYEIKLRASSFLGSIVSFGSDNSGARMAELERENEALREELFGDKETGRIKVYSTHPFTSRSEIAIAAGVEDGIRTGDVIVVSGDILVGRVTDVFESSSVVTTIFDPSWEIAVRIGEEEIDALMQGGNEIKLTLIPMDSFVEEEEKIITASEGFPYGLELGFVREVQNTEGGVFKEALINPSFRVSQLRNVSVYR